MSSKVSLRASKLRRILFKVITRFGHRNWCSCSLGTFSIAWSTLFDWFSNTNSCILFDLWLLYFLTRICLAHLSIEIPKESSKWISSLVGFHLLLNFFVELISNFAIAANIFNVFTTITRCFNSGSRLPLTKLQILWIFLLHLLIEKHLFLWCFEWPMSLFLLKIFFKLFIILFLLFRHFHLLLKFLLIHGFSKNV